jgi:hypothetical protein
VRGADHLLGNARVEEVVEDLVGDQEVPAALALLQRVDLLQHPRVVGEEAMAGVPVTLHQRATQEEIA